MKLSAAGRKGPPIAYFSWIGSERNERTKSETGVSAAHKGMT
jgi:hypothetical protein